MCKESRTGCFLIFEVQSIEEACFAIILKDDSKTCFW